MWKWTTFFALYGLVVAMFDQEFLLDISPPKAGIACLGADIDAVAGFLVWRVGVSRR